MKEKRRVKKRKARERKKASFGWGEKRKGRPGQRGLDISNPARECP